jgi:aspartate racemase
LDLVAPNRPAVVTLSQKFVPGLIGMSVHTDSVYWHAMHRWAMHQILGGRLLNSLRAMICSVDFLLLVDNIRASRWIEAQRQIAEAAKALEAGGAHFIVITSNTGHTLSQETAALHIPILDIAKVTCMATFASRSRAPGLLATSRCTESGMYQRWAREYELEIVSPPIRIRDSVNELIFDELTSGIVSDAGVRVIISATQWFAEHGADSVIFGCTDLTLLSEVVRKSSPIPIFDSTRLHAESAARAAIEGRIS